MPIIIEHSQGYLVKQRLIDESNSAVSSGDWATVSIGGNSIDVTKRTNIVVYPTADTDINSFGGGIDAQRIVLVNGSSSYDLNMKLSVIGHDSTFVLLPGHSATYIYNAATYVWAFEGTSEFIGEMKYIYMRAATQPITPDFEDYVPVDWFAVPPEPNIDEDPLWMSFAVVVGVKPKDIWATPLQLDGVVGLCGPAGLCGLVGFCGIQGLCGPQGVQGAQGEVGACGVPGLCGPQGVQGAQGVVGFCGVQGLCGPQGVQGAQGVVGFCGIQGLCGPQGVQGAQGVVGFCGVQGLCGPQGVQGSQGIQGLCGQTGLCGPQGVQGSQGVQGLCGQTGLCGPQGVQGSQGVQGLCGQTGLCGPQGVQGAQGVQGLCGQTGLCGPQGVQGSQGVQGLCGQTGLCGPQGVQGSQGVQGLCGLIGLCGPQGVQGAQGICGPQGSQGICGPQGNAGIQGIDGEQGPQGYCGAQGPRSWSYSIAQNTNLWVMFGVNHDNTGADYITTHTPIISTLSINSAIFMLFNPISNKHYLMWSLNACTITVTLDGVSQTISPNTNGEGSLELTSGWALLTVSQSGEANEFRFYDWTLNTYAVLDNGISVNIRPGGPKGAVGDCGPQGACGLVGNCGAQGIQGLCGIQGTQGIQGLCGPQGAQGIQGLCGPQGSQGIQGSCGLQGLCGIQGAQGIQGLCGSQGSQGIQGLCGPQGSQGIQGNCGPIGLCGVQGTQGIQGLCGPQGAQGIQGVCGPQGAQGIQGNCGLQGLCGAQGTQGIQGLCGPQGAQGLCGIQGTQGIQGLCGPQGAQGIQGLCGPQGAQGIQGVCGPQGICGIQGQQGPQGLCGQQGAQGICGIQGQQGPQGLCGQQGAQGICGIQGQQGPQGPCGPCGAQGIQGAQGPTGFCGGQGVLGTVLASGVTINAGGYFRIGSGDKDDTLTGIWIDDTEIVAQDGNGTDTVRIGVDGSFYAIKGTIAGFTIEETWLYTGTISTTKIVINAASDSIYARPLGAGANTKYVMLGQTHDGTNWTGNYGISAVDGSNRMLFRIDDSVKSIAGWNFDYQSFSNITTGTGIELSVGTTKNVTTGFSVFNPSSPKLFIGDSTYFLDWNNGSGSGTTGKLTIKGDIIGSRFSTESTNVFDGSNGTYASLHHVSGTPILFMEKFTDTSNYTIVNFTPGSIVNSVAGFLYATLVSAGTTIGLIEMGCGNTADSAFIKIDSMHVARWRGRFATDPTTNNREGDMGYHTGTSVVRLYTNGAWTNV